MNINEIVKDKNWTFLSSLVNLGIISIDNELKAHISALSCNDIYNCLRFIPSLRSSEMDDKILKWGSSRIIYMYCYSFVGVDDRFKQALLNTNDSEYIYRYAKYVLKNHDEEIFNFLFASSSADYTYFYDYAKYLPNAPLDMMSLIVLDGSDAAFIKEFLEIEALKEYPQIVSELINKLKVLNTTKEIVALIISIDLKLFNLEDCYLYNNFLGEIKDLCSILDYETIYNLVGKLHTIQVIDLLNNILYKMNKDSKGMSLVRKDNNASI